MTDTASSSASAPDKGAAKGVDALRIGFWVAITTAAGAAGVALTMGQQVGPVASALFIGLAAVAFGFVVWVARGAGAKVGLFPDRGAAEAAAMALRKADYSLLEAVEEPALLTDRNGAVVASNGAYRQLAQNFGVFAESARPPMMDRLFGADPALAAPMFRLARAAALQERRKETLPPVRLGEGGMAQRFEASVGPAPSGQVLWRLRPIAAAAEAEDAVDGARRLFIDEAPVGFFAARPDGTILYANQALRSLLGYGEDIEGLRLREIVREDPARVLRRDRRGMGATRMVVTLRGRDGADTKATAVTFWPPGDPDGACRTLVFFGAAEAEAGAASPSPTLTARGQGDATQSFFGHAPFGAALLDGGDPAAAAIIDSNAALMEMAQGAASPGVAFVDLFDASEGPEKLAERLRKAMLGQPVELQLATSPPVAAHVHVVRLGDGRGLAYILNVTESRELEQRLAQSEKMREIGLLAGGVAHDFNNLLNVMMQTLDYLLLRHPVGDPDYVELNRLKTHALRARELSEMLRAYARQQTFKTEVMEVAGFVQQIHELARRLAGDSVKVEVRHAPSLPLIRADRTQLERVLVNLVSNARDAMMGREGAKSVLGLRTALVTAADVRPFAQNVPIEDGDYVTIEVSDTGMGIKPEDHHKIFHPFHSTKDPGKGTGLGLATCYGIIKQSGGYIFFDSRPGEGTTFRVYLPAHYPSAEELEEIARREREKLERKPLDLAGRGRILFVEDEDDVRQTTARNLARLGFEIVEACDGVEALEIMEAHPGTFRIVLSDLSMPGMSGAEMLKTATPAMIGEAKILCLSGYAPDHVARMLEQIPYPVSVLSKPVDATELAQKVKELLAA
jgi:two-component system cell cycle sensor histidine kinase/response regulator CckA